VKRDMHIHPFIMTMPERLPAFIERAIELGFEEICMTDHMPLLPYLEYDRLREGQVETYAAIVRRASEQYADRIRIRCGIEMDYTPELESKLRSLIKQWPEMDLYLGSTHPAVVMPNYQKTPMKCSEFAEHMLKNELKAAKSGLFHTITHLDVYRRNFLPENLVNLPFTDDNDHPLRHEKLLRELMHIICEENQMLEINGGLLYGSNSPAYIHPAPEIVQMALDAGVRFVFGSDAHWLEHIGQNYDAAMRSEAYRQAMLKAEEDNPC